MATAVPTRLLGLINGHYFVFDTQDPSHSDKVGGFDIVSYRWGDPVSEYDCNIRGVKWKVKIPPAKLDDIKRLMRDEGIRYMWADCVCINAADKADTAKEVANMYDYYQKAKRCHILIDMERAWHPQGIVDDLALVDHVIASVAGASIVLESKALTDDTTKKLRSWAEEPWAFPLDRSTVESAAVEPGLINCYATCIDHITSLFENKYFSRVWTFQEILLGKQICMWSVSASKVSSIGGLEDWFNLATDARDKAEKLQRWIETSRVHKTDAVNAVLAVIHVHKLYLISLQARIQGIHNARTDIITGGPSWWVGNPGGVSNIFSAVSIVPRECTEQKDVFRGLLGIFNGLFSAGEIEECMQGNMNVMTFEFFWRLSKRTGHAWTRLVLSGKGQTEPGWDWIPVVAEDGRPTTDCFAGVVNLGILDTRGNKKLVVSNATTIFWGSPRPYVDVTVRRVAERDTDGGGGGGSDHDFRFFFRGCNCGKSTGSWAGSSGIVIQEPDRCKDVTEDETGRFLVRCGTILGRLLDPGYDIGEYRRRLFDGLGPVWKPTDANARPVDWVDRCVSGTYLATASHFRVHNESAHYNMAAITKCKSRLCNDTTKRLECVMRMNCGCQVVAPFCMLFEAITAVRGSSLGARSATRDDDGRITLTDGLGLVQVEEAEQGREQRFRLIALEGSADAHRKHALLCMSTPPGRPVDEKMLMWPKGRALVDGNFSHGLPAILRGYGYVEAGGAGNLLLTRSHPLAYYRVMGVCIDNGISDWRKVNSYVTIHAMGHPSTWPGISDILQAIVKPISELVQSMWLAGLRISGDLFSESKVVYERLRPFVVTALQGIKDWIRARGWTRRRPEGESIAGEG